MTTAALRTAGIGLAAGAIAVTVVELLRPLGGREPLLDWEEVRGLARARIGGRAVNSERLELLGMEYERLADEVRGPLLEAVGGLPAGVSLPPFQALDRERWLDVNLGVLRQVMAPVVEASVVNRSRLTLLGKAGVDRYLASMLAFLGGRVLGQFDPQLMGREPVQQSLYLVEPNVAAWEAKAGLEGYDLRRWLILHELTHAWQFSAHPWLRDHLNTTLERLIELSVGGQQGDPLSRAVRVTVGAPAQWRLVRRLQATMSLIEGYGNLAMNMVGRRILPSYERLEAAYEDRSGTRSPFEALLWRVTGLELKMQQYRLGEAFASHIRDLYGMDVLNRVWEGPDTLPTLDELRAPQRWYTRVVAPSGRPRLAGAH
jgi:coenzyme F420 biosynthesis associated uncharacterized protein